MKKKKKNKKQKKQKTKKLSKPLEFQQVITKDMVKHFSWFYASVPHVLKIEGI